MRIIVRWLPALAIVVILYYLSSQPVLVVVPKSWVPLWLEQKLSAYSVRIGTRGFFSYALSLQPEFVVRKLGHFTVFALLGASLYFATWSRRLAIALAMVLAGLDELHQGLVPGRDARLGDILIDSAGALCGILLLRFCAVRRLKKYDINK